jgi:hypothetical protein
MLIANLSGEYENVNKIIVDKLKKCNNPISNISNMV